MAVKFKPEGYHTVTPLLSVKDAKRLIEFMKVAFNATEVYRFNSSEGKVMHAEMKIGDSVVMLGEAPEGSPPMPVALYIYVDDVDARCKKAVNAGSETLTAPADMFWGDRVATVRDFAGNRWWLATHVEEVSADELERRAEKAMAA
ncbi:MAG: VOC family protein [Syntrophobacteraceae bacterium]|nr:VOC family protein [Syntrophobacteraceae bacterium]